MHYYYYMIIVAIVACILIACIYMLSSHFYNKRSKKKVNKALDAIRSSSQYSNRQQYNKPSDPIMKNRKAEIEKKIEQEKEKQFGGVVKYNPHGQEIETEEQSKIVGVAEPKGFWSKFIASQKFGYILARMNMQESSKNSFWVNLIKAQSMSQGKDQGRKR